MEWDLNGLSAPLHWIGWAYENRELLGLPAAIIAAAVTTVGFVRYLDRQRGTYRLLVKFFEEPRRARREWWSGRMWMWWSALPPIHRARLRAELDILDPQGARPHGPRVALGRAHRRERRDWRNHRKSWERTARDFERRLLQLMETHESRIKTMTVSEFEAAAPLKELHTPAELDHEDRRERIVKYFQVLEELRDAKRYDFGSFLTYVKFSDGYIAPAFLIAGLMSRFEDDWTRIIGKYRAVLDSNVTATNGASYSRDLAELRSFQFNCWLLWGPSIPLCTCGEWIPERRKQGAAAETILMQYGFGDEANCVDFMVEADTAGKAYQDWLRSIDDPTFNKKRAPLQPGEPRHVGAIPGALIGQIMWGQKIKDIDLSKAQKSAISGTGDVPGRVVLRFTKRLDAVPEDGRISNYYSAYVWVMFALVHEDGTPWYAGESQAHRNLLPFFEHGNIADATTLQTIKENLVSKSLSAFSEIVARDADRDVFIAYVGASDHSGCSAPTRYPQSQPYPFPDGSHADVRPPRILDILRVERDVHRVFMRPAFARRLVLPKTELTATLGDGRFAACHLPQIVENFMKEVSAAGGNGAARTSNR